MLDKVLFEYVYRDASNYKAHGHLLLTFQASAISANSISAYCDSGAFFVAEQVGIPPLYEELWQLSSGPTTDDHAFHEFVELREATEEEVRDLPVWGTLDELLQAFRSVKEWDVTLSPNCAT